MENEKNELLDAYMTALQMRKLANHAIVELSEKLFGHLSDNALADVTEAHDEAQIALSADEWMIDDCKKIMREDANELE